jgi:GNAT superfamily N-acetyltransferase
MMAAPDSLRKVDAFWAGYFGCAPEDLNGSKTLVLPHAALQGYDGVLVFRHGGACLVSVPDVVPAVERAKLAAAPPDQAFNPEFLAKTFVVWKDRVSPPAWVGICDRADFRPVPTTARLLTARDGDAIERLAEGCGELAWKASKLVLDREPNFGLFVGNDIVAASGYLNMGGVLAYIGVVTHPAHRGKGYAKAVVSATMNYAFERGLVAMWRTPASNESAISVARSLGFSPYAFTLDVQLTEDEF